jgi:hypothetical protein
LAREVDARIKSEHDQKGVICMRQCTSRPLKNPLAVAL